MVEGRAYQRYDLATLPGGRITGRTHTNDNLDRGYPTEEADWPPGAPSLSMARQDFPVPLAPFGHGAYSACGFAFGRPRPPCGPANSAGPQWLYASRGSATADYAPSFRSPWRAAVEYRDFDAMRKSTGLSHTGVSGVEVTVVLDGKRI